MLHNGETIFLQDLQDFLIIHTSPGMEFSQVASAHDGATKFGIAWGKELAQTAADAGKNVGRVIKDLSDGCVEGIEQTSEKGTLRHERVIIGIKNSSGT